MTWQWVPLADVTGNTGAPGDPLSPEAIAAAEAAAEAKIDAIPAVPKATALDQFASVVVDQAGRIGEASRADGTKYFPSVESDRSKIAGTTTVVGSIPGYASVKLDRSGKIEAGVLTDGTNYFPAVSTDRLTITGPVDVLIMGGQSNSEYDWHSATLPTIHPVDPSLLVWYGGTTGAAAIPSTHPDDVPKGIARAMRQARPHRAVLVVPAAVGGAGFTGTSLDPAPPGYHTNPNGQGTWDRALTADPKNLALALMASVQAAIAFLGNRVGEVRLGWIQGESDAAYLNQSQYATLFDDLVNWIRTTLGLPKMTVVVGGMVPERTAAYSAGEMGVPRAHIDTPRRLQYTAYQPGPINHSEFQELVHYSRPGRTIHGKGMAAAFERAALNVTDGKPIMPNNVTIKRVGTSVTVSWVAPACRATDYFLETSVDGGATWVAQALADGRLALSHTMTVPVGTELRARLHTQNEVGISITTTEVAA